MKSYCRRERKDQIDTFLLRGKLWLPGISKCRCPFGELKINSHTKRGISAPSPPQKIPTPFGCLWFHPTPENPILQHSESLTESIYINKPIRSQSLLLFLLLLRLSWLPWLLSEQRNHPQKALGTAQTGRGENALPQWCPHIWGDSAFQAWHSCTPANSPGTRKGQKRKESLCVWCSPSQCMDVYSPSKNADGSAGSQRGENELLSPVH